MKPPFQPLRRAPAYRQVAEAIERRILAGELRPGERLGTEAELVRQFGVNRSTVREGIRVLEHEGLIGREAGRRLRVERPPYEALASRWSRALLLHEVSFRELYEAALITHCGTARLAAERATPELLAELEDNLARTEASLADARAVARLDAEFHALVARAAGNRVLQIAREPMHLLVEPTTAHVLQHVPEGALRLVEAHRRIVQALRARDAQAAAQWVRRHLEDWRRGFERSGRRLDEPIDRACAASP